MNKEFIKKVKTVYGLLMDDISREVFENRLMFNLTGDRKFLRGVISTINEGAEAYDTLRKSIAPKAIFGAGQVGKRILKTFDDINFDCFIDNMHQGELCESLPIISLEEFLQKYENGIIVISTKWVHNEIKLQLLQNGVKEENIINIGEKYNQLSKQQYFDLPELAECIENKEIFLDGGGFDGESSVEFVKWYQKNAKEHAEECTVYIWEPGIENIKKIESNMKKQNVNYILIKKGLWNKSDKLRFCQNESSSQIVSDNKNSLGEYIEVEVDRIDAVMSVPATFIKMDIEGSEYEALLGAKEMISKYKPKLAISVYHKKDDIWELPWLIHNMNPAYKFYLRHYSFSTNETVLYAL